MMKKISLKQISLVTIFALQAIACTVQADVYLENSYGAPIKYMREKLGKKAPEKIIPNGGRSESLGVSAKNIPGICIKTSGVGSGYGLSPYFDLQFILEQIKADQEAHYDKDAIISVDPSQSAWDKWNVKVYWENPGHLVVTDQIPEWKRIKQ
jgi:hypothetical protein